MFQKSNPPFLACIGSGNIESIAQILLHLNYYEVLNNFFKIKTALAANKGGMDTVDMGLPYQQYDLDTHIVA